MRLLVALLIPFLGACASYPDVEITSATPASVAVAYSDHDSDLQAATDVAEAHCQSNGRHAEYIGQSVLYRTTLFPYMQATFRCSQ